MSLAVSCSNRRPAQQTSSSAVWPSQRQSSSHRRPVAAQLRLQKQHSFAGSSGSKANYGNLLSSRHNGYGCFTRGLSVDRSIDPVPSRRYTVAQKSSILERPPSPKPSINCNERINLNNKRYSFTESKYNFSHVASTSSLIKSLDRELKEVNSQLGHTNNFNVRGGIVDDHGDGNKVDSRIEHNVTSNANKVAPTITTSSTATTSAALTATKGSGGCNDTSKINLNIVLAAHVIKIATETESNSDIDSCSESVEANRKKPTLVRKDLPTKPYVPPINTAAVQQRRAQFRNSRNATINTSITAVVPQQPTVISEAAAIGTVDLTASTTAAVSVASNPGNFSASPSLSVQGRPPLVRAMSAPVRSRSLDENTKSVFALNKRKFRRRKLITRNASVCERSESSVDVVNDGKSDIILNINGGSGAGKKPLSRARSTLAADVITLVSLVSSEGSDSEREDSAQDNHGNLPSSGSAPSLRKTGKSVSFQENYPPNFQLATKEYSHMIRRGSLAPLAARLRANRPPTAPPVSIFMSDPSSSTNIDAMGTTTPSVDKTNSNFNANLAKNVDKENAEIPLEPPKQEEYIFPEYVRGLKERECWKLFRKMSTKGISVTYETVLRGMLTPTEFRQIQKQRELEEAKARALEEEKDAATAEQNQSSAVDRLTQKLLRK